mmetsp:Transcript_15113/g.31121  ORF Transcript_15113/g.31121 Transcript_15113/m.31121 type:complete len:96 (-) Transcript_15113:752-1039(-)
MGRKLGRKRGSGKKGVPGVYGIARSSNVALGEIYRQNRTDPLTNPSDSTKATRYRRSECITPYDSSSSRNIPMRENHPFCDSMFSVERVYLYNGA